MGIENDRHVAVSLLNLFVHLGEVRHREVLGVEAEVFVAVLCAVLVSPLDVHDEHIDGEFEVRKVLVALHDSVSVNPIVLGEVEAKGVQRGQGREASDSGKVIGYSLVPVKCAFFGLYRTAEEEELNGTCLRDKVYVRTHLGSISLVVEEGPSVSRVDPGDG